MIKFLTRLDEHRPGAELRAGGTDVMDRARHGLVTAEIDDLRDVPDRDGILGGEIGAGTTIATIAADPGIVAGWPALAMAAGTLATPQVREVATLGGNLAQKVRCAWFRDPAFTCLLRGGTTCPAREGDRQMFAIDDASCIAVHPSTIATALLVYGAGVERAGKAETIEEWIARPDGDVVTRVILPVAAPGERGAYRRAIHRARAEWPLVEIAGRRVGGTVFLAAGGVAFAPVRLARVEAAAAAGEAEPWKRAAEGWRPDSRTAFKVPLLVNLTRIVLEDLS